jgi:TolA-binding protein
MIDSYDRQARYPEKHNAMKEFATLKYSEDKGQQAQWLKQQADKMMEQGETAEPITLYRMTAREYPETRVSSEISILLGQIMEKQGDYQNAAREYENVFNKKATSVLTEEVSFKMGKAYKQSNKNKEAIEIFQKLLMQSPNTIFKEKLLYELATTYYNQGDKIKAKEEFNKYLKEYPNGEYYKRVEIFLKFLDAKKGGDSVYKN